MPQKFDRIDKVIVAQGLLESRSSAQAAIAAGQVTLNGRVISKPSEKVPLTAKIKAAAAHPWASRAGLKLEAALDTFNISVDGRNCLDIGASTGGFTDVLLARGAKHVTAVDVGTDQIIARLRNDHRVTCLEQTDARLLSSDMIAGAPDLLVCDASFISLSKLLQKPLSLLAHPAEAVLLFKPQFEVGRHAIGKGGVVSDANAVASAENSLIAWMANLGWVVQRQTDSPIVGGDGNRERLLHFNWA